MCKHLDVCIEQNKLLINISFTVHTYCIFPITYILLTQPQALFWCLNVRFI